MPKTPKTLFALGWDDAGGTSSLVSVEDSMDPLIFTAARWSLSVICRAIESELVATAQREHLRPLPGLKKSPSHRMS